MRSLNLQLLVLPGLLLLAVVRATSGPQTNSTPELAPFELRDQYDISHRICFPATNVTIMTVADRKGSEQIDGWVGPLKERYKGGIGIAGVADMSKVPRLLRSMVREKFKQRRTYPVMLDWDGSVSRNFHYKRDEANVFVIDQQGRVAGHFTGIADEASLGALFVVIDLTRR